MSKESKNLFRFAAIVIGIITTIIIYNMVMVNGTLVMF
jgi:hypothetical protein